MKFAERLQAQQPVVYQTLKHALMQKNLAHAFLFVGQKGTPRLETALLLAQSRICQHVHDGFACEECIDCQRIAEGNYADLILLDGASKSIKKEEIRSLQERFNKTGLERSGQKVYILNNAENTTPEALNSLLKFLEEPQGSDTLAILIVENQDRILPTIVSRCQTLTFRPLTQRQIHQIALEEQLDETDGYLLSHMIRDVDQIKQTAEDEAYQNGMLMMRRFIREFPLREEEVLVWIQTEYLGSKDKEKDKRTFGYFIDCLLQFLRDAAVGHTEGPAWMAEEIGNWNQRPLRLDRLIIVLLECRDKLSRSYNLPLLADQLIYQMKEGMKDE